MVRFAALAGVVNVAVFWVQAVAAGRVLSQIQLVTPAAVRTSTTSWVATVDLYQLVKV
jgi:hypothetical protein